MKAEKKVEILIYDQIGEDWFGDGVQAKKFAEELRDLGDIETIELRINSPGGSVWDGNAIYNTLRGHKATVNVTIDGLAASIASVIAMSGDTITMPENALMMIHNPATIAFGEAEEMRKAANMLD
ncbi:Clp protease ClpP, partial [bacterium]|nr:Clp protease ClpP [bacterium]